MEQKRTANRASLELDAEVLVAHQLDLIAQLEYQLRAVHRAMRKIEQPRSVKRRIGPELSNGEKATPLDNLTDELAAIHQELNIQHESCVEMQRAVDKMRATLRALERASAADSFPAESEPPAQPPA